MAAFDIIHKLAYGTKTPVGLVSLEVKSERTNQKLRCDSVKKYEGVLDTGSGSTYFPLKWLSELGLKEIVSAPEAKEVGTLLGTGTVLFVDCHVRLWLNGLIVPDKVRVLSPFGKYITDRTGKMKCIPIKDLPYAIIGQDVLLKFYTRFDGPLWAGAIRERPCCSAPPRKPSCFRRLASLIRSS